MTFISSLENYLVNILIQEKHNYIEREKIVYGVRLILNDFWKVIIIYLIAYCLNCFTATLITHIVFYMLRQVCFGFHFQNNIVCLITSIISLPVGIFFIKSLNREDNYMLFLAIISTLVLLSFAPIGTKKRPVFNQNHRVFLRKKLFVRLSILWTISILLHEDFQYFILYAIVLIAVSILTQKILGGNINED